MHNVDAAVVHTPTLKPFDADTVLAEVDSDRLAVTLENHTVVGGLFETVAAAAVRARGAAGLIDAGRRCPTNSSPPARCRPCTTATASRPARIVASVLARLLGSLLTCQMLTLKERCMSVGAARRCSRLEKTSLREQALSALRRAITTRAAPAGHASGGDRAIRGAADQSRHAARGDASTAAGGR